IRHSWVLLALPGRMRASRLQLHFDEDIIALNPDRIGLHRLDGRHGERLARAHIETRTVAWASNGSARKSAVCQRRPIVRTHILNGVVLSINIKDGHRQTIEVDLLLLSWC